MGMYTEFVFACKLKNDTPEQVINILDAMDNASESRFFIDKPEHEFFKCREWAYLFTMDSCYFDGITNTIFQTKHGDYYLTVRSNIKNYDSEIEKFIDWISPYIDGYDNDFLGYYRYEEFEEPTLIYLNKKER